MADNTIDTLELEIQSNSDIAVKSLNNLVKTLESVRESLNGVFGDCKRLSDSFSNMDGAKSISETIKAVKKISKTSNPIQKDIDVKLDADFIESSIESLREKFRNAGLDFSFSGNLTDIEKEILSLEKKLDGLFEKEAKLKDIGVNINTQGFQSLEYDISSLLNKLDILRNKREEIKKAFSENIKKIPISRGEEIETNSKSRNPVSILPDDMNYNPDAMAAVFGEGILGIENFNKAVQKMGKNAGMIFNGLQNDVEKTIPTLKHLTKNLSSESKLKKLKNSFLGLSGIFDRLKVSGRNMSNIFPRMQKSISGMFKPVKKLNQAIQKMNKSFNSSGNSSKKFGAMGMLGMSMLYSSVFQLFYMIQNAVIEGGQNLAQYSAAYNNSISSIVSSLLKLKNAFAVAFAPIVNIVAPYLAKFINLISIAMNKIGQFFAALTGKTFTPQAVTVVKDYAAGLQDTSGGMNDAADSAKKLKKALSVLSFDQLNQLSASENVGDSGGGGTGSSGSGEISPSDMFTNSPIEKEIKEFAEKIKKIFSSLFRPFKEAWNTEGANTVKSAKKAFGSLGDLAKSVGKSFMDVWTNGTGVRTLTNILKISKNIFDIIGNLADQFTKAWNSASIGVSIIQTIFDLANIVLSTIENITAETAKWSKTLDFTPLLNSVDTLLKAIEPLAENVGQGLEWFWNNVLLPMSEWTIKDAVPVFLDMVSSALGVLNELIEALKPLGGWFWDEFLKPLGSFTGKIFIGAMKLITDLLDKLSNWISKNQKFVEGFAQSLLGAGTKLYKNWEVVKEAAKVLKDTVSEKWTQLKENVSNALTGMLSATKEKWEQIKGKFSGFSEWLQGIFSRDWSRSFGIFGDVLNGFMRGVSDIWDSLKETFNGIITFINGVFSGNWKKAWSGIKNVFSGVFSGLSSIVKAPINAIIGSFNAVLRIINSLIRKINSISFRIRVPSWIPIIGGSSWGFNGFRIPTIGSIPYLAKGGLTYNPTLAMIGEAGKEAVLPLENKRTMSMIADSIMQNSTVGMDEEVLTNAVARGFAMAMMNNQQSPVNVTCYAELRTEDNEVLARAVTKGQQSIDYRKNPTPQFGY